jgi:hypothetical protein
MAARHTLVPIETSIFLSGPIPLIAPFLKISFGHGAGLTNRTMRRDHADYRTLIRVASA